MIKRDGIAIMNARAKNVSTAKETLDIIKNKSYIASSGKTIDISEYINKSIEGTILYRNDTRLPDTRWKAHLTKTIEVTNETTVQAAIRLGVVHKTDIVALNFASARNQGGGFLSGAIAQEEDLCRRSGLYACLKSKPMFYNENIMCDDCYYTNNVIYSPRVPFFKDEENVFLDIPFTLSIVSSPAPNLSGARPEGLKNLLIGIIRERTIRILDIAASHGHKNIILGAWGCGAFGNDPVMIAEAFKLALNKIPAFDHICFAVYDTRPEQPIYKTFKKVILQETK